jgi:methyltransferase-like protein
VRKQAGIDGVLTNIRHQTIRVGDFEKFVLPLLDGTRNKKGILTSLQELVQKQQLQIRENNILIVDPEKVLSILEKQLDQVILILGLNSLLLSSK